MSVYASGQATQKQYLTMWDDSPDMGFESEPIRTQAEVSLEESGGVFSDESGFFSGEDVYNSCEDVGIEDDIEEEEDEQFEETDLKDLHYFFSEDFTKLDEVRIFSIDFDRLIELMRKSARMLDLFRGAKLVEVAIVILKRCVNFTERFVQDIACSYRRDARKNADRAAVQTNGASSEIPVIRARSRKNLSDKLATADSQITIDFDDIPIDVKARRLHLQKKFNGLISNALLDFQFDLRSFYMHEPTNDQLPNTTIEENFDCGRMFKDLKRISARENTASIIQFNLSNNNDYNTTGFDDYDELTGDLTSSQTHQEACDSDDPVTASNSVTNEVSIERMETNQIEDETENQLPTAMENVFSSENGQQIPAVATNKKKRKLRERDVKNLVLHNKRRKPLEALNAGDPEVIRDETDGHNFDPEVTTNELLAEVNQTELARIAEGDISLGYHSQSSQFDQCSDVEDISFNTNNISSESDYQLNEHDERLRVPSPICGNEPATSHVTFKSTVNMKKLTADIQETLESQAAREEVSIEELIFRTNLNIKGVEDESVRSSSKNPEISLHDFLFASLHAAVNLRLFLEPMDNGSVVFTKTRPDD